jgi:thiol-disulfide isomerase/thioredoxin
LFAVTALLCSLRTQAQDTLAGGRFILSGTLIGRDTGTLVLAYFNREGDYRKDTTEVKCGVFSFTGAVRGAEQAMLTGHPKTGSDEDPECLRLYLESRKIAITLTDHDFHTAKIEGSVTQTEWEAHVAAQAPYRNPQRFDIDRTFVFSHPNSFLSAELMEVLFGRRLISVDSAESVLRNFPASVRGSWSAIRLAEDIKGYKASLPGQPAFPFEKNDIDGHAVKLSDYKGHYVLLDFWASWCVPCRQLTPRIKNMYAQYHPGGLEVVGISWDFTRDPWVKAVAEDSIGMWKQVSGFFNPKDGGLRSEFGIQAIPTEVLIDPHGIIVGKYLGDDSMAALEKKLSELIKP